MTEYMDISDINFLQNDFFYNPNTQFQTLNPDPNILSDTDPDTVQKTKWINIIISGFLRNHYQK